MKITEKNKSSTRIGRNYGDSLEQLKIHNGVILKK